VPVEKYEQNLIKLVKNFITLGVDVGKIIMISPPAMEKEVNFRAVAL